MVVQKNINCGLVFWSC